MAGLMKPVEGERRGGRSAGGQEDAKRTEVDDDDEREKEELRGGRERDCEGREEDKW